MHQNKTIESLNSIELARLAKLKASKLLCEKVESKLLSVCSITGIAISIETPAIEGFALTYQNPLSEPQNFLAIASLPVQTLSKLEAPILSGIYLGIAKYYEILDCPMTAAAQNLSLQSVHPLILIDSIKFYASALPEFKRLETLPKFNLLQTDTNGLAYASVTAKVKAAQIAIKERVYPVQENKELAAIYGEVSEIQFNKQQAERVAASILRARKSKAVYQTEQLKAARKIVKELAEQGILSDKFLSFLKLLLSGDTLLNAEVETKERAIRALAKHQNSSCIALIAILRDAKISNLQESIFAQQNDMEVEEELREVEAEEKPKRTLKEILEEKKAQSDAAKRLATEAAPSTPSIQPIQLTSEQFNLLSPFEHFGHAIESSNEEESIDLEYLSDSEEQELSEALEAEFEADFSEERN